MARGRTKENDTPLDKWQLDFNEYPNKPEIGYQSTWYFDKAKNKNGCYKTCLLYTSPSPRDRTRSRMPSSA